MLSNGALTDSKKKIISLLRQRGGLTKKDLSQQSGLGWATVVKALHELIDEGLVISKGTNLSRTHLKGKNAYVYALNPQKPLIIGIDVEHTFTTLIITNLEGTVFLENQWATPTGNGERMIRFLTGCIEECLDSLHKDTNDLAGIGIGLPGLTFPTNPWQENLEKAQRIEQDVSQYFHTKVRVDTNTNAYTLYA
ncbi:MAG: transcriptional regulator, partial [Spirochaetes bacterium]|nr:transcriptional regulator [Spirochaetota bacterium]